MLILAEKTDILDTTGAVATHDQSSVGVLSRIGVSQRRCDFFALVEMVFR